MWQMWLADELDSYLSNVSRGAEVSVNKSKTRELLEVVVKVLDIVTRVKVQVLLVKYNSNKS